MKILYIKSSPREERSYSIAVADAYLAQLKKKNPSTEIIELDLFNKKLPSFDGETISAKYAIMHGAEASLGEKKAWQSVEKVINEFKEFDHYVFAVPMWNFGLPYVLKHYFDIIIQPTYTFSFSPGKGYDGLIKNKSAMVVYARGGTYPEGSSAEAFDHQKRSMETMLNFIGLTDIKTLIVEPTLHEGPKYAEELKKKMMEKAKQLADNRS